MLPLAFVPGRRRHVGAQATNHGSSVLVPAWICFAGIAFGAGGPVPPPYWVREVSTCGSSGGGHLQAEASARNRGDVSRVMPSLISSAGSSNSIARLRR